MIANRSAVISDPDLSSDARCYGAMMSCVSSGSIEVRNHLLGPCARRVDDERVVADVGSLVRRLVLFERYTLRTVRMLEMRELVRAFGEGGLRALLADGCLHIHCDALSMASTGTELPAGQFRFAAIRAHDQREYVSSCLQEIHQIPGLSDKQVKKLKRAIADVLSDAAGGGVEANRQLDRELDSNAPVLRDGVVLAARSEFGLDVGAAQLELAIERVDELTVRVTNNLESLLGLEGPVANKVVERGLLAVGGLATRLELMQRLRAISGCLPGEMSVFDGKLRALEAEIDPDAQERRLVRVLDLAELPEPDLESSPAIDVDKLLEARRLPEARALRDWLRTADRLDDDDIRDSFNKVREAMARAMHSNGGKVVRLGVTTAAGLLPGGAIIGAGLSAIDSFLIDRVVGEPGPYSFLSESWPSLFTGS